MSNLVERFKIVIPSLNVRTLGNNVMDERRKQERRKRKECIALYGEAYRTPVKKPRVKRETYIVPVEMLREDLPIISNTPPEVVLQHALFLNGKCYEVKDDDSCVSSLSARSSCLYDYASTSIVAVTPTDPEEEEEKGDEKEKKQDRNENSDGGNNDQVEINNNNKKMDQNDAQGGEKKYNDEDDLLYAKRKAKYDLTMKVIELKKQDPTCVLTDGDFIQMTFDVKLKHKLPVLALLNVEDIYTTIHDYDEFTTVQEKEIALANQYGLSNLLWGESEEYKRTFRIEKAKAANDITQMIYERMQQRTGDKTKHVSMAEFREIVHHVRQTRKLPDDMVFNKKYFNKRIKKNQLFIDPSTWKCN
jgi:hypothetical protein